MPLNKLHAPLMKAAQPPHAATNGLLLRHLQTGAADAVAAAIQVVDSPEVIQEVDSLAVAVADAKTSKSLQLLQYIHTTS